MSEHGPDIRLNTVGIIQTGAYAGWYVVVLPQDNPRTGMSYQVFLCTDTSFQFEPGVRECYDTWAENDPTLLGLFEEDYGPVEWHEEIEPPQWGPPDPRMTALIERFRARRAGD